MKNHLKNDIVRKSYQNLIIKNYFIF